MSPRSYALGALLATAAYSAIGKCDEIPAPAIHTERPAQQMADAGGKELGPGQPADSARDTGPGIAWKPVATWAGHKDRVTSLAFAPDGSRLFSSSFDGVIKVWDMNTRKEEATFVAHTDGKKCTVLDVSPAGDLLATGASPVPGEVKIWDARTLQLRTTLRYPQPVYCLAFSRHSDLIAAGGEDTVYVWNVAGGRPAHKLAVQMWPITGLAFSPDGRILYVGGFPAIGKEAAHFGVLRAFDLLGGSQLGEIKFPHPVEGITLDETGKTLGVAATALHAVDVSAENHRLIFRNRFTALERQVENAAIFCEQFHRVAVSGRQGAIAGAAGSPGPLAPEVGHVAVFDLRDGQRIAQLEPPREVETSKAGEGHTQPENHDLTALAFSPDGRFLAAGGQERTITLWRSTGAR